MCACITAQATSHLAPTTPLPKAVVTSGRAAYVLTHIHIYIYMCVYTLAVKGDSRAAVKVWLGGVR